MTRVLLVDDHAMLRHGLRTVLEEYANLEVVGEATNGEQAAILAKSLKPDVVCYQREYNHHHLRPAGNGD